ncbi:hypothetical protein [Hoeflea sp.]|uniref:hypothetical protein n=1 Tax=Hoeflea sp. TaxID=1940281 RepID=UPI003B02000D
MLIVTALLLFEVEPGQAQTSLLQSVTGEPSEQKNEAEALNTLIEDAQAQGSTVIVIAPPSASPAPDDAVKMAVNSEMLLMARTNVRRMLIGADDFRAKLIDALERASPDGTPWWLAWAVGTAVFGMILGIAIYELVGRWIRDQFAGYYKAENLTRADKLTYLMLRGSLILASTAIMFTVTIMVAVVLDYEHEPSRMTIFTIVATYACYRILRYVIMLNFFAPDLPKHRMISLDDKRARKLYNDWIYVLLASSYILGVIAWVRGLGIDNDSYRLLSIGGLGVACLLMAALTVFHRKDTFDIVRGTGSDGVVSPWRNFAARATTPLLLLYIFVSWVVSSFRLSLGLPGGYIIIMAPIIVFIGGALAYAVAIVILDRIYERRAKNYRHMQIIKLRRARAEARRREVAERIAAEAEVDEEAMVGEGEEMIVHHVESPVEEDTDLDDVDAPARRQVWC